MTLDEALAKFDRQWDDIYEQVRDNVAQMLTEHGATEDELEAGPMATRRTVRDAIKALASWTLYYYTGSMTRQ